MSPCRERNPGHAILIGRRANRHTDALQWADLGRRNLRHNTMIHP
jgi:hypothetical protein